MAALTYVTAPGNIEKALLGIKAAATPEQAGQDFVKSILKIPGGSGNQVAALLKKIGFVKADGSPSDIYKRFRNPTTSGAAVLEALRVGYPALFQRNETWYKLADEDLRGLIVEETGQAHDSSVVNLTLATIKGLKKFADLGAATKVSIITHDDSKDPPPPTPTPPHLPPHLPQSMGLNLGYTINLNLPATSDIAVFNAIFKSLKEHLLKNEE
ncbi:DUF5343 domain-containing protein [Tardiphaga sp.]|jgi:hypothetical protein|uniref:DUF5343 domain-containing protein n=1 Tax=Tardiphaga sp. TaxID=1926292 RepID=UPI0037DA6B93